MSTWLQMMRARLEARVAELQAELDASAQTWREGLRADRGEVTDQKDQAGEEARAETQAGEFDRDLDELRATQAALRRLHDGSYGRCADCGEVIDRQRLLAQPAALRCAGCQRAWERRSAR
jgi:DnaK suppressor protein